MESMADEAVSEASRITRWGPLLLNEEGLIGLSVLPVNML